MLKDLEKIYNENELYDDLDICIENTLKFCCEYANHGVEEGIGGPFGAAVIQKVNGKYKVVSIARNTTLNDNDPTAHAEINAIRGACKKLQKLVLNDCILLSSARSCPMCLSAACWARIPEIKYVLDYDFASNSGFIDNDIYLHLNGKKEIIKEEKIEGNCAKMPFSNWDNKEDKILY